MLYNAVIWTFTYWDDFCWGRDNFSGWNTVCFLLVFLIFYRLCKKLKSFIQIKISNMSDEVQIVHSDDEVLLMRGERGLRVNP
jgi:hypothetical protein